MIKKVDHIVITTGDIEKCVQFYEKIGFRAQNSSGRWELFAGDFKINVHIKGQEFEPKAQNVTLGSQDLCFEVDDNLEILAQNLLDANIPILLGIVARQGAKGAMYSIYLRDPDENLIELCSYI